jgi:hypothetical protein
MLIADAVNDRMSVYVSAARSESVYIQVIRCTAIVLDQRHCHPEARFWPKDLPRCLELKRRIFGFPERRFHQEAIPAAIRPTKSPEVLRPKSGLRMTGLAWLNIRCAIVKSNALRLLLKGSSAPRLAEQMIIQVALARPRIRPGCDHCIDLAYFDGAAVLKMRTITACFHRGTVVRRFDQVEAS